ncbi:unnamed protein product [Calicophoron daubneyi]|uniref:Uncharacterized protein n=1 Tax=Calicophoron daubneyi TaxID=300641 RepID=A0AAV2TF85_CALDB
MQTLLHSHTLNTAWRTTLVPSPGEPGFAAVHALLFSGVAFGPVIVPSLLCPTSMLPVKKPPQALYVPPARRRGLIEENVERPERTPDACLRRTSKVDFDGPPPSVLEKEKAKNSALDGLDLRMKFLSLDAPTSVLKAEKMGDVSSEDNFSSSSLDGSRGTKKDNSHAGSHINYKEFQHVLELYDFPKDATSADLQAELSGFEDSGFYLKWVDDTHCLAVFSSPTEASRALSQISGICLKARPMNAASPESKTKLLKSPGDWAMPYKKRPLTTSATARRLISGHLGLKALSPKSDENLEKERQDRLALAEARAQNERRRKAQRSIWNDESLDFHS